MSHPENHFRQALEALREKDYRAASGFFKAAENQFADNLDFRILSEVTALLVAVKEEINEIENEGFVVEEIFSDGQETELRG
jgi:hypothetical protein